MKNTKSPRLAVVDEIEKAGHLVNAWVILKDNTVAGQITARSVKNDVLHVAFYLYAQDGVQRGIYGYRRMTGAGYPKVDEAVVEILKDNIVQLQEDYRVTLHSWNLPCLWMREFEPLGYSLWRVL